MRHGIASLLIITLLFTACATVPAPPPGQTTRPANLKEWMAGQSRAKKKAIAGAIIGGVAGLVTGRLVGANSEEMVKRALAGAVAGAIAGFAIGKHDDQVFASRDLAIRHAGYDKSQGYLARVEEVTFLPANPKPGMTAKLYIRYLVLGPDPNEAIRIRMFRGLKYGDDYILGVGPNDFTVQKGGGIIESTVEITLPKKAPEGTYSVEALLEDEQGRFPQASGSGPLYIIANAHPRGGIVTAAR
ncbi:MAG TPA: hypothetical protein VEK79_14050 [Thermoanaerobaculia bacterium]|nr:hypothetical protein [Thermoanaerobaculia bacterium]